MKVYGVKVLQLAAVVGVESWICIEKMKWGK